VIGTATIVAVMVPIVAKRSAVNFNFAPRSY
jgi:hypothetical protein